MDEAKMPDRLYYSVKAKQLLEKIDEINYFGLGLVKGISRSELFLFAMSLGVESQTMTEIANPLGLILDKSIDSKTQASMYAQFISLLTDAENELDAVTDRSRVYKIAERYANTGFKIIEDYFNKKKPEDLVWDLFLELDGQYEKLTSNSAR